MIRRGPVPAVLTQGCDALLDLAVVVLSTWTVVYHVSLVLRLSVAWAAGLEVGALALWIAMWMRSYTRARDPEPAMAWGSGAPGSAASVVETAVLAAAQPQITAALLVGIDANWPVIAALWVLSAVAGTALAVLHVRRTTDREPALGAAAGRTASAPPAPDDERARRALTGVIVALVWATVLAALSMFTRRANPDDLYYVNLSQWVVDHGTFPLRDTIFSDLVFPMSSWPPVASYDALAGLVASLSGVPAASVVYLLVPPVATWLSVLALWRLLRRWQVAAAGLALSLALVFLLFDGGPGYAAPGSVFLTRIWQGKVILLCLMVPTLLVYALRYVERPTATHAWWLFAGGVAAVGLSTSAMFLVPLLALAGVAPLALRRPRRALIGLAAMAVYPLAAGLVTVALGGRSADLFGTRLTFRFDPAWFGPQIFRDGAVAVVAVAAVLAGALLIPHLAARVTTGVLTLIVGVTFIPGVTYAAFELVGLGPTLWRVSWVTPIAALVGVLGVRLGSNGRRGQIAVTVAAAVLIVSGVPIWTRANGVDLDATPQWKLSPPAVETAQQILATAEPGALVLAPPRLSVTLSILTTKVKTVAPRAYFMDYLRDDPTFHYPARMTLSRFVGAEPIYGERSEVVDALALLHVDQVCMTADARWQASVVRDAGFESTLRSAAYRCFSHDGASRDR